MNAARAKARVRPEAVSREQQNMKAGNRWRAESRRTNQQRGERPR
jgi:hypothetical protein